MYDIHCHLLPGIDDGAGDIDQALVLARCAVENGITHMVATPHIQPGVYDNNKGSISNALHIFQAALMEHAIPLQVAMAAEVRLCPEILPMLEQGDIPLFVDAHGKQTMLLELPHSHVPPGTEKIIQWLMKQDLSVLIAHPERNKELMRNYSKIERLRGEGCLFQVTADSMAGEFGEQAEQAAQYIAKQEWCDILASDAHNLQRRPPRLGHGQRAIARIVGEEKAALMTCHMPKSIVVGLFSEC